MTATNKKSYSNFNLMRRSLVKRGYEVDVLPLTPHYAAFRSPRGTLWLTRWAALSYPFQSVASKQISKNKSLAYAFAEYHGVTIPATLKLPAPIKDVEEFFEKYDTAIVKPADSSGSRGLTMHITTPAEAEAALQKTREFSTYALLQQQVSGKEVRFTVMEGELVSVMYRETARVTGDGKTALTDLIARENQARTGLQFEYLQYPRLDETNVPVELLYSSAVPAAGEEVVLNYSSMVSQGASVYELKDQVHDSYTQTVLKLARELNHDFLIVDMMIKDLGEPQADDNYAFIEFNTSPALRLYYGMRSGPQYDIVERLADMIDQRNH